MQWKATCTLSTLWQRFGRGARGEGYQATAILLVGKQDIREKVLQEVKDENMIGKKQKRKKHTDDVLPKAKRPALTNKSVNTACYSSIAVDSKSVAMMDVDIERPSQGEGDVTPGLDVIIEECRSRYTRPEPVNDNMKARKKRKVLIGSPIDDYINAHHFFPCRRIVLRTYFGNDRSRT